MSSTDGETGMKNLADKAAQKIQEENLLRPTGIVQKARRVLLRLEIEPLCELHSDARFVGQQNFLREQLPLLRFSAGVANRAGRAARNGNRMMPQQLEPPQRQQRNQAAHMQAVARRIEAAV